MFRQSLKHYVGTNFSNPADLDSVIIDITNRMVELMTHVPKQITLIRELRGITTHFNPNLKERLKRLQYLEPVLNAEIKLTSISCSAGG